MNDRLIDIREIDFPTLQVSDYNFGKGKNSAGEDFQITVIGVDTTHIAGEEIEYKKDKFGIITQKEIRAAPNGYISLISGVSRVGLLVKKAPIKSECYMSMTQAEKDDFDVANLNDAGAVDLTKLEYIPKIKICRDDDLTGGWDSQEIVKELAARIGVQVYMSLRSYWVKQVMVDTSSTFFDAIMSIVSFMEPIVYVEDGVGGESDTLYILDKPLSGGSVSFENIRNLAQQEVYNFNSDVQYMKLVGGLGRWIRDKVKGNVQPEKQVELEMSSESEQQVYMTIHLKGDMETIKKENGVETKTVAPGTMDITVPMKTPSTDKVRRKDILLLDPFGNRKAIISSEIHGTNDLVGTGDVPVLDETITYEYDFLDESFETPRQISCVQETTRMTWMLTQTPGGSFRARKSKTDVKTTARVFAPNGSLLREFITRETDVLVLQSWGLYTETTYIELELADMWWTEGGSEPPGFQRLVVEEMEVAYRQLTPKVFEKATYRRTPDGLRRKQGDERRGHSIEMLTGRVPKYPKVYRRYQVYAEDGEYVEGTQETPSIIISNPNVITWDDAEALLKRLVEKKKGFTRTIVRQIDIPVDLEVDVGWTVLFSTVQLGEGEVPEVVVIEGHISAYRKVKNASGVTVSTMLTLEGKV